MSGSISGPGGETGRVANKLASYRQTIQVTNTGHLGVFAYRIFRVGPPASTICVKTALATQRWPVSILCIGADSAGPAPAYCPQSEGPNSKPISDS